MTCYNDPLLQKGSIHLQVVAKLAKMLNNLILPTTVKL